MNRTNSLLSDLNPKDFPEGPAESPDLTFDLDVAFPEIKSQEELILIETKKLEARQGMESLTKKIIKHERAMRRLAKPEDRRQSRAAIEKAYGKTHGILRQHPEHAFRQQAAVGMMVIRLQDAQPEDIGGARAFFDFMVGKKYWIEVDPEKEKPSLEAWKWGFRVPEDFCFGRSEFEEVKRELKSLVSRTMTSTINRRNQRAKEIKDEYPLASKEVFLKGDSGSYLFYVPPKIKIDQGNTLFYGGGFLVVDSEKERFLVQEGIGSFENRIRELDLGSVSVEKRAVEWDFPYARKHLQGKLDWNQEKINGYYLLWDLLKRGKYALESSDDLSEEKLELSREVTLPEEQFFLNGEDGVSFVDFEGICEVWETKDGKNTKKVIQNIFFLVERKNGKIAIIGYPETLQDFFAGCLDSRHEEGEKFSGIPQPLRAILQAQYGACQTKALIA